MRKPGFALLVLAGFAAPAAAADPAALERAWHGCLREAYAHQPPGQSRAGDQRNALDACKEREDAYVAAMLAAQPRERTLGARSLSWAASVAASVIDPVTAWLRALGR